MPSVEFCFECGDRVETVFAQLGIVRACLFERGVICYSVQLRDRRDWYLDSELKPSDWKDGDYDPIRWRNAINDSP